MTESKTILVVEDSPGIREAVKGLLESEGYHVELAENGRQALEMLAAMPRPCLILLDLMMPDMDGWAFTAMREKDVRLAPIPLVVVSGAPHIDPPSGPGRVIKKPIDLRILRDLVRDYCQC